MAENPHTGHRERLRERFLANGSSSFHDYQLVELLLTYALPRRDVNPLAHELINHFGSLYNVLNATPNELMEFKGVGESAACLFQLVAELSKRNPQPTLASQTVFHNPTIAAKYCASLFTSMHHESVFCITLDKNNAVIHSDLIGVGGLTDSSVHLRTILEYIIRYKAAHIVIAHNHPSGNVLPSTDDINFTVAIRNAIAPFGVMLWDHIIVGYNEHYSTHGEFIIKDPERMVVSDSSPKDL